MQDSHRPLSRELWIDLARGICMMLILLDHTEVYYAGDNVIPYHLYVENALAMFFFLSGYLFYKPVPFSLFRKLASIARSILMPYFIFTFLVAIPKALVRGEGLSLGGVVESVLLGQASWFIAALAVAELIFAFLLWITRGKDVLLCTLSLLLFSTVFITNGAELINPWYWKVALMSLLFICLGYLAHEHEGFFNRMNTLSYSFILILVIILLKYVETVNGWNMVMDTSSVSVLPVFFLDCLLGIWLLTNVSKALPRMEFVRWTGEHSIVYYFLCGGVPLLVTMLLGKMGFAYDGQYYRIFIAFVLVYLFASVITWLIYRYVPFVTGRR